MYYAHSGYREDKSDWQKLADHLHNVAKLSEEFGKPLGIGDAAYVAGLFHDLGKYTAEFQRRLQNENIRVDHSTAGAALLRDLTTGDRPTRLIGTSKATVWTQISPAETFHEIRLPNVL
jgi:CRISPR-associated endonuclease/helicase Cas3